MIAEPAHLEQMLGRLKLTAIRDQLDSLLDEAAKGELTLRETLILFCEREIARKDERRIGGSSSCRQGVTSRCRLTDRAVALQR
jgi:hypothetical protein